MQRNEVVALVAGASIGMGGGPLGAFVAWAACGAAARHFLDRLGDQDIELRQPAAPGVQYGAEQVNAGSAPVTQPASDRAVRNPAEAVTSAQAPRDPGF
jgi:hypothetical protein